MNKLRLLFCLLIAFPFFGFSQSKRPQVLVYGSGVDAFAAALQSAKSNLNTVWVVDREKIAEELTAAAISISTNRQLDAGIWADLLAKTLRHEKRNDSVSTLAKQRINPQIAENAVNDMLSAVKSLTIVRGMALRSVKKSGKNWQVELSNRQRYKVRTLVDASENADLYRLVDGAAESAVVRANLPADYFNPEHYQELSRTGVAVGDLGDVAFTLPLAALIPADDSNLFLTRKTPTLQSLLGATPDDIPLLMHVGQAVGAAAAYAAFFKTTSDKLDLRSIQGELLQYGARLMPFQDISIESPHFAAIQRIGATGMLWGEIGESGGFDFNPSALVSSEEIEPVLNRLFSRSQIWFIDNEVDTLKLSDLLSLIKYIGQRGSELEGQVEKAWVKRYQFEGEYDADLSVSRTHVAALLDAYCKPFDVKVGLDGSIQR